MTPLDPDTARLLDAIAQLPAQGKRVLTLCKVYGWTHDRIAQRLGLEQAEVEHDLSHAVIHCARHESEPPMQ